MSRSSRIKDLGEELRRLFDQDISEEEAYNQVKDDDRFDVVRLPKVSAMFKQFRSNPKRKMPVNSQLIQLLRRSEQLTYFQSIVECDHKLHDCLKFSNGGSSDGRFFVIPDRMAINGTKSNSTLNDVFSNKAWYDLTWFFNCSIFSRIKLPFAETAQQSEFWPLTHDAGFLCEREDYDNQEAFAKSSLSLLEFDFFHKDFKKIHTLQFENQQHRFEYQQIIIDSMDPTHFLLHNWHDDFDTLKIGRVYNDEILFGEEILSTDSNIGDGFCSLIDNTLYSFNDLNLVESGEVNF